MRKGDEIISESGEIAQVHIILGDEVVAKRADGSTFIFKLGAGDWLVYKSKLLEFKSIIDNLTIEQLQEKLLNLRAARATASPSKRARASGGARVQAEPKLSAEDKGILAQLRALSPEQIKALKARVGMSGN